MVQAQVGTISGLVKDAKTGDPLIGATILVKGTSLGAATDFDGNYKITGVPVGSYSLDVSYISYTTKTVEKVKVSAQEPAVVNVSLASDDKVLNEVQVVSTRRTNTDMSVISDMKKAEMVVNAVSAQQIQKAPDRDVAQVIRRVPGITIVDDRFVVVRGLSNRYNTVMLNGVIAPSTEADSRAFSFDVIPSNFLERLLVYKSGSPELPGEFGGAVVKIYTKNQVEENFTAINYTVGYRAGTTFNKFNTQSGGEKDWLTMGNSSRALPTDFPSNLGDYTYDFKRVEAEGQKFANTYKIKETTAVPDQRIRFDFGRKFKIGGFEISSLNSVNYSNTFVRNDIFRGRYDLYQTDGTSRDAVKNTDNKSENNARIGLISNWSMMVGKSKYEFKNLYTRQGSSETTIRSGQDIANRRDDLSYSMRYQMRTIYTTQFSGTHGFNNEKSSVNWTLGYTNGTRKEPDWKRVQTSRPMGTDNPFEVNIPSTATVQDASRFYSDLNENTYTAAADFEQKIGKEEQVKVRAGFYFEDRGRTFQARTIGYIQRSNFNFDLLKLPYDQIFDPANVNIANGLLISEHTGYADFYKASNAIIAPYLGGSWSVGNLVLAGGVRVEKNTQKLETAPAPNGVPKMVNQPISSVLPFINASYAFTEKVQLRASFGKSINRPEFRELAPFSFYNFDLQSDITGNPNLVPASIQNIDARLEIYPNAGELISFGGFYKNFTNPIETYIRPGSSNPVFVFDNAKQAKNYGLELELRKSLASLSAKKFFQNLSAVFNASLIKSEIELNTANGGLNQETKRPMQGQSPYVVNLGLYYQDSEKGFSTNVFYNVYGKRIFLVGDNELATSYEMPRHVIDLSIAKRLMKNLELRVSVNDLLNTATQVREDGNRDGKIDNDQADKSFFNYKSGSYYTVGFNYKF